MEQFDTSPPWIKVGSPPSFVRSPRWSGYSKSIAGAPSVAGDRVTRYSRSGLGGIGINDRDWRKEWNTSE